jgi:hypothetical protein
VFAEIKDEYKRVAQDTVGERFEDRYERRSTQRKTLAGKAKMVLYIPAGFLLIILGIAQSLIPGAGPGSIIIIVGLALLSGEFLFIARLLDKAEAWVRKHISGPFMTWWKTGNPYLRALFVLGIATFLLIWVLYLLPNGAEKTYNKTK